MNNIPEMTNLSNREIAIMWIMKGNPDKEITSFYLDDNLNCFCKFKDDALIYDFSLDMQFAEGVFNRGKQDERRT